MSTGVTEAAPGDSAPALRRLRPVHDDPASVWLRPLRALLPSLRDRPHRLARAAERRAARIDDWTDLPDVPDGAIIALEGRLRPRRVLPGAGDARRPAGLVLRFLHNWPVVLKNEPYKATSNPGPYVDFTHRLAELEVVHDFDLEAPSGHTALVLVKGARIAVVPMTPLEHIGTVDRLVETLDLPPFTHHYGMRAHLLCEGDPLTVIGFKDGLTDPMSPRHFSRRGDLTVAIRSGSFVPAIVVPTG